MTRLEFSGLAIFGCIAAAPAAAAAQQASRGLTITDQKGAPISLAEVKVRSGDDTADLLSDDQGHVALDPLLWKHTSAVHVEVSAVGYASADLEVAGGVTADTVIRLKPVVADGADIVVVARNISRPFSPQTLNFLDIVTDPKAQADPILAVNNLPASTNVTGSSRLTFRGSRAAINRAYLNDAPAYEFSTGSELDSSTENRSIFGLVVADEVETYPGSPPTYLAGATGGVVRVVTPSNKTSGTTISITDLGVSGGRIIASGNGDGFIALYGSLTDLALHKAINPGLNSLFKTIRSTSGGGLVHLTTSNGGAVNAFFQAEAADDAFPFSTYGTETLFRLKPVKARAVVSASVPVSDLVLNASAAFTRSHIGETFGRSQVDNDNSYGFGSLDVTRRWAEGHLRVRVGFDGEYIKQVSDTALAIDGNAPSAHATPTAYHGVLRQMTGFIFATYRQSDILMLSVGARHTIASNIKPGLSLQASATLSSSDQRHKLIVSVGQYTGAAVPTRAYYGPMSRSVSKQIEADYSWQRRGNTVGFSMFYSTERSDGGEFNIGDLFVSNNIDNLVGIARQTISEGLEAYATWMPITGLEVKASFSKVHQVMRLGGQRLRGANDYPGIIRASLKYATPAQSIYSLSFTHRSGEPFTRADGIFNLFGAPAPIYGPVNGARLPAYMSLDASISRRLHIVRLSNPLVFVGLSNITDYRNPSSQILTLSDSASAYRYLAGRSVVFGLTTSF